MTSTDPYEDRQWVDGWNYDAEIADLLKQLTTLNPLAEDDETRRPALIAQLREYQRGNEEEAITGGYERTWYLRENGRKGRQVHEYARSQHHDDELWTMGEEFDTLDRDEQRDYLSKHHDIRVEKVLNPPLEPGASVGLHVAIDGVDHGIYPYPV